MCIQRPHRLQSLDGTDLIVGCWELSERRALTLWPAEAGELRIVQGRVWVTFENAQQDGSARGGDHFLGAGDYLKLLPGQVLVMESWNPSRGLATCFNWHPVPPAATTELSNRPGCSVMVRSVVQSLRDLRFDFGLIATDSARLASSLVGVALESMALVLLRPELAFMARALRMPRATKSLPMLGDR